MRGRVLRLGRGIVCILSVLLVLRWLRRLRFYRICSRRLGCMLRILLFRLLGLGRSRTGRRLLR